jgi:hypothetical protein
MKRKNKLTILEMYEQLTEARAFAKRIAGGDVEALIEESVGDNEPLEKSAAELYVEMMELRNAK